MNVKTTVQEEALKAWMVDKRGTILLGTGLGKTRLGVMIAKAVNGKTVIVTSRTPLVQQWKDELGDFEADVYVINTASKLKIDCDLLIIDEAHRATAPTFSRVFDINYKHLLCLTATLPAEERAEILIAKAPVVYSKTIDEVPEASAPYTIVNIPVKLGWQNAAKYKAFDRMFKNAIIALARVWSNSGYRSIFELARTESKRSSQYTEASKAYWTGMTLRKQVLYNASEKMGVVKEIIASNPSKKWIIFTKSIKFAEELHQLIGGLLYHSKLTTKERVAVLEAFKNEKVLISVDALNEGLNVPDADGAICVSAVSTELVQIQSLGRILRQKEGKKALFVNLYVPDSQEEKWVRKKISSLKNVIWHDGPLKALHQL